MIDHTIRAIHCLVQVFIDHGKTGNTAAFQVTFDGTFWSIKGDMFNFRAVGRATTLEEALRSFAAESKVLSGDYHGPLPAPLPAVPPSTVFTPQVN